MGKRSNFQRRPMDAYATPLEAVRPLVPFLLAEGIMRFAEPCCGDGELIRRLESFGLECVHASDILQGVDALTLDSFAGADAVVSNTPWSREILHRLIEHFMRICPTWLLFDADWAHTRQSGGLIRHCSTIVSIGRVRSIPGSPFTGKDNAAWYRFDGLPADRSQSIGRGQPAGVATMKRQQLELFGSAQLAPRARLDASSGRQLDPLCQQRPPD